MLKKKVMIVGEDRDRFLLEKLLESERRELNSFSSAEEALPFVRQVDLLIIELNVPDYNSGLKLVRNAVAKRTILIFSEDGESISRDDFRLIRLFLKKPYDLNFLREVVRRYLNEDNQ